MSRNRWGIGAAVAAAVAAAACTPSATVRRNTPVASLQSYRQILVRVDGVPEGRGQIAPLEMAVAGKLRQTCAFEVVLVPAEVRGDFQPDLILDLNIQRSFRGGEGLIRNENKATVDVLMVLSDGINDDLLGSAWIRGESSAVLVSGSSPEGQAVGAVADSVADVMKQSGCTGPRVARQPEGPEPPPPADDDAGAGPDPAAIEQAEKLNDEGKALFRSADVAGAAARFEQAIAIHPDPRYYFNLCFSYETLRRWDDAVAACNQVYERNPSDQLRAKTDERLQVIAQKRAE